MSKTAKDVAAEARVVADVLGGLPDECPLPTHVSIYTQNAAPSIGWLLFGERRLDEAATAREIIRSIGGKWDKSPGELFGFEQQRGIVQLEVVVNRESVCRRVVTGTETVTETVPDPDAPLVEVTKEVDTVEWQCEPLLAEVAS